MLEIILMNSVSGSIKLTSTATTPAETEDNIRIIPAINVNNLINPEGVGFVQLYQALSISNALIKNAPPRILTRTANISAV